MKPVRALKILLLFWLLLLCGSSLWSANRPHDVVLLEINGAIGPATSDYVTRELEKAHNQSAQLIIIQMDTPGGLDTAMRDIIQAIIASPIPIVSYVAPSGARAASAGTYILYASHIAAMAPATNLGAATPVQIMGMPGRDGGDIDDMGKEAVDKDAMGKNNTAAKGDPMKQKIINDAVAYIQGLARMRGRNAEWAELAVRQAASLTAEDAKSENVIDLVATDVSDLLAKIDGRRVKVLGMDIVLSTSNVTVTVSSPDWRSRLLAVITDPNIAYILMLIGVYGLIYEFANPGMILPGVAGTICLLLAFFAFQVLPINYAGLALMLLGIAFMVGEVFVPSFGALGIGGVIAFVIGSILLLDTGIPGYGVSRPLIGVFALSTAGFFMLVVGMMIRARQRPVVSGMEQLIGSVGEVIEEIDHEGRIRVHSESWQARSAVPVPIGQRVRVTALHGLVLDVEPIEPADQASSTGKAV